MGPDPMVGHGHSRLRIQFYSYLAALHALLFALVFYLFRDQPWAFLGLEVLLVGSFLLGVRLLRRAL